MKNTLRIAVLMALFVPMATMAIVPPPPKGTYTFDENGNWSWSGGGNGQVTEQLSGGGIQYDESVTGYSFYSTLVGQTYGFFEKGTSFDLTNLLDVIHFDDASHFSYYSDPGDTDLADLTSGSLQDLLQSKGWSISSKSYEVGPEGNNLTFSAMISDGGNISFSGINNVPEPASFSLVIIGGLTVLGLVRRSRR